MPLRAPVRFAAREGEGEGRTGFTRFLQKGAGHRLRWKRANIRIRLKSRSAPNRRE
jgi:hypothetical protein